MNAPRGRGRRLLQLGLGLVLGVMLAEGMFWWRDDGAFPHVNFYLAEPVLGTRLQPNASERLAFGGNPRTTIATNALGFRTHASTADGTWPAPADDDVLVGATHRSLASGSTWAMRFRRDSLRAAGAPCSMQACPPMDRKSMLPSSRRSSRAARSSA